MAGFMAGMMQAGDGVVGKRAIAEEGAVVGKVAS